MNTTEFISHNLSKSPLKIGPYQVLGKIGEGGMGEVFLVSTPTGPPLALKKMRVDKQKKKQKSQFLNEARFTSKLKHPSIIPIYEVVDKKGLTYFTMPYIEGKTLKQIITNCVKQEQKTFNSSQDFPVSKAINIFLQVCQALAYAHSEGMIHRDLKPSNIMVDERDHVQILDWGLIVHVDTKLDPSSVSGTIIYMAPELILGASPSFQSDIYSLGLILYQMLTFRYPFHRDTMILYYQNLEREALIDPAKVALYRNIPPLLSKIALKCLESSPSKRYQNVSEILQEMQNEKEILSVKPKPIIFPGISLVKKAKICENKKLAKQIFKDCQKLRGTPGAPLEYIVQALIYQNLQQEEAEFKSFTEAYIRFPNHPLTSTISKHLFNRLKQLSKGGSPHFYRIAFLALTFISFHEFPLQIRHLMKRLKLQTAPIRFIDEEALKTWSETTQNQALSVHLAFLLGNSPLLGKLFDIILNASPSPLQILTQILMCLIKLGALKLAQQKLDLLSQQFLDVQAIVILRWIQEVLRFVQGNSEGPILFLSEIPKKPTIQHLFPVFLILDESIKRKKTSVIFSTLELLIKNHYLDDIQLLNLDCYLIAADLLNKNMQRAEKILQFYFKKGIKTEKLEFLEACRQSISFGTSFSLPKIQPKMLLSQQKEINQLYSFFSYLLRRSGR